ncbi:MAG: hypothetical protein REI09_15415 [Candidatus Dactylopiibacterium sp.]|nr:hypothetical protein [Candidatus Dactylopiibacterium sp.]
MRAANLRWLLGIPAVVALVCGVLSGLARLGWGVPAWAAGLAGVHGALMVGAFFGTLIGLERAVALARGWPYLAPAASGLAGLLLVAGHAGALAPALMSVAAAVMTIACASVWWRERAAHLATLTAGALAWLAGNLAWLALDIPAATPLWATFLILTIAGERLELSRLMPTPPRARRAFAAIALLLGASAVVAVGQGWALRLFGAALGLLALWLMRFDIARRTVRSTGLTRYMAVCLLTGYAWLLAGAMLGLSGAFPLGAPLRDAGLHAVLLGFVISMVFGHAPVIVPALTRLRFQWHGLFYLPLCILHLSLVARVGADIGLNFPLRAWAAAGNAVALLLFMILSALALRCAPAARRV